MKCDCSVNHYDGECSFFYEKMVKAKKQHQCCECGRIIKKGEQYEYVSGRWNDYFSVYRTCLGCSQLREDFCPNGWEYTGLREQILECTGFDYVTNEYEDKTNEQI